MAHGWSQLQQELTDHIIAYLLPNEVACNVRLINKAATAQFCGQQHTTVRLSQPVPEHAFKWRWAVPGAMRSLTFTQRQQLLCLTASSGSTSNLKVAATATGCSLTEVVFEAAAAAQQLESCKWLMRRGCPCHTALKAAAAAGHIGVCDWLLANGIPWAPDVALYAARNGHIDLAEELLKFSSRRPAMSVLLGVVEGCDLGTLQRLHRDLLGPQADSDRAPAEWLPSSDRAVATAASSPTADWQAKVVWLEELGYRRGGAGSGAASRPDALDRLRWLRQRGYRLGTAAAATAAKYGNVAVLSYLLQEGVAMTVDVAMAAVRAGQLAALIALHAAGCPVVREAVYYAAHMGHLPVVKWLVETPGVEAPLSASLFGHAARSGSLELLTWLHERGCPWDASTFSQAAAAGGVQLLYWLHEHGCPWDENAIAGAAERGCEEVLEWLVEKRCPMGLGGGMEREGWPYVNAARNGDLATMRCLLRLGCPWSPTTFEDCVRYARIGCSEPALRWLLDKGCPVDWAAARRAAGLRAWDFPDLSTRLVEQERRRGQG